MNEELKIRIHGYKKVEKSLVKIGAKFTREIKGKDTYFNQTKGEVMKITEDDTGNFLVNLKNVKGKFQVVKYEEVSGVEKIKKELSKKYGVKCILKKKRRFFDFGKYMININLIENVGEFLIVEGKKVPKSVITDRLKIKKPEFIIVSFDELKVKAKN